jgi:hypothetical protein
VAAPLSACPASRLGFLSNSSVAFATKQKTSRESTLGTIRVLAMYSQLSVLKLLNYQITPITKSLYFVFGLAAGGSCAQKPVVCPLSIQQVQRPPQCTVALHVVPQAPGKALVSVFNCRAEIVPAQRTAVAIAAMNVFLIVLLMIHSPL